MYFPDDILNIIRAYARPCVRRDWRTCKQFESNCINDIQVMTLIVQCLDGDTRDLSFYERWTLYGLY